MSRTNKYQAAGHATIAKRGAWVGATAKIRELLSHGEGWEKGLTKAEIVERTGYPSRTISTCVSAQAGHTGGLVAFGRRGSRRYALTESPAAKKALGERREPDSEFAIAGEIVIGRGFRWGAGW